MTDDHIGTREEVLASPIMYMPCLARLQVTGMLVFYHSKSQKLQCLPQEYVDSIRCLEESAILMYIASYKRDYNYCCLLALKKMVGECLVANIVELQILLPENDPHLLSSPDPTNCLFSH